MANKLSNQFISHPFIEFDQSKLFSNNNNNNSVYFDLNDLNSLSSPNGFNSNHFTNQPSEIDRGLGIYTNTFDDDCLKNISLGHKQTITKSLQPKIRRERIGYYLKFGESGSMDGQFAEPSGIAINADNHDIYIADANNHRVQVFDKWGKFKFHFGEGKLKFPNRVALSKNTGDIVVSERPPVHQIQVYNRNGSFVCKFGAKHLRHPRGLTIDHKNRIIVVECKVMKVFIFNLQGVLLNSFDCSEQIQFPNAVAVSRKEEIFISDNRNHCVKVFTFTGEFIRQIGGQGITNYPIGVCLNESANQLLVIDNYNNLNVTIFRLDGQLIGAFESSAKHQQCLDVALFGDHSIAVTSKDLQTS
ncbi:NHL repeat containing protein [Sarcoptes scabiei]|uniref:NHL repeat containing protein n=1 Tax=Sarcoptes scabiei TaxID=52283 RepID=A0A132ADW6_SARSC|nr:NHL repeat containing protein [Sarcoptes scabiei]